MQDNLDKLGEVLAVFDPSLTLPDLEEVDEDDFAEETNHIRHGAADLIVFILRTVEENGIEDAGELMALVAEKMEG